MNESKESHFIGAYLLFALFFLAGCGRAVEPRIGSADCRYRLEKGDSEPNVRRYSEASYNDSDWERGTDALGKPGDVVWIRCRMKASMAIGGSHWILFLGRVADEDETYVNGQLIGSSLSKIPPTRWNYFIPRKYFVHQSLLTGSEMVVSIRAKSVVSAKIGLIDRGPEFRQEWIEPDLKASDMMAAFFALVLTAIFSVYSIKSDGSRRLRAYFTCAGLLTSILEIMNSFYPYRSLPGMGTLWLKLHMLVTILVVYFLFRFSEDLLGLHRSKLPIIITLIFGIGAMFIPGWQFSIESVRAVGYWFALWGIPTVAYGIWLSISALRKDRQKKDPYLWPFLFGSTLLILAGGWDLIQLSVGSLPVFIPASGIGFLFAISMAALALVLKDNDSMIGSLSSDITQWKARHDSLAVDAALGEMLRQIAHDVRSPLSALRMASPSLSVLQEDKRVLIRSAIDRISDIATELLEKGKRFQSSQDSSFGTNDPQFLPFLIEALVAEKRLQFKDRKNIKIQFDQTAALYSTFVSVKSAEFNRVLSNLIDNAIDAISGAGSIDILVSVEKAEVLLIVRDDGKGIGADVLPLLGRKGVTFGKQGGHGLGLWHAVQMATKWDGSLNILSVEGQGTSIELRLPIAPPPIWFETELVIPERATIVVVDDDEGIHRVWQGRMQQIGRDAESLSLISFSSLKDFSAWWSEVGVRLSDVKLLVDQEFVFERGTGLDVIELKKLNSVATLVTSRIDEGQVTARAVKLGIKVVPKTFAMFVPIVIRKS